MLHVVHLSVCLVVSLSLSGEWGLLVSSSIHTLVKIWKICNVHLNWCCCPSDCLFVSNGHFLILSVCFKRPLLDTEICLPVNSMSVKRTCFHLSKVALNEKVVWLNHSRCSKWRPFASGQWLCRWCMVPSVNEPLLQLVSVAFQSLCNFR